MYPADTKFPVYCRSCWFSDKWDATDYGRDYDFSKPFFVQFSELLEAVPRVALQVDMSTDCDYCNQIGTCKNCYLITSASDCEDSMFSYRLLYSKNIVDGWAVIRCENCYECLQSLESANMKFCDQGVSSVDLLFCYDTRGSQSCFMSSNLRGKKHVFRNQEFTKEEYKRKISEIDTGSYANLEKYKEEYGQMRLASIHKFTIEKQAINSSGDSLGYTKNCKGCFYSSDSEDLKFCLLLNNAKDAYDVNNGCCGMERSYEVSTVGVNTYDVKLSADIWPEAREITYSQCCRNGANNLFGCVGMRKKQYCVLNKQYSKEDYESLVSGAIEHMRSMPYTDAKGRTYKYGEFFPTEISLFSYNETMAHDFLPLTKEKAGELGYGWKAGKEKHYEITTSAESLPNHIRDVKDDITQEILGCLHKGTCEHRCTKAFRITPNELVFYRKMNLALPRLCPNCRHYERFRSRNPLKLWKRRCMCEGKQRVKGQSPNTHENISEHFHGLNVCPNEFETSYAPERPEVVYCEACYNAEVV